MKANVRVTKLETTAKGVVAHLKLSKGEATTSVVLNAEGAARVKVGDKLALENGRLAPRNQ